MSRKSLLLVIGLVLSVFFLVFAFSRVEWRLFVVALNSVRVAWTAAAAAALLTAMFLRGVR